METMFDVYTKEVVIGGNTYKIRPLSGRFLPKFYKVVGVISAVTDKKTEQVDTAKLFENEEAMSALHIMAVETLKKSYPNQDTTIIDEFVSQNLLKMLDVLIQVNMPKE